jgi:hypothetical protein
MKKVDSPFSILECGGAPPLSIAGRGLNPERRSTAALQNAAAGIITIERQVAGQT